MYKMYKLSDRPLTLNIGIVRSLATHREKKREKERKRDKKYTRTVSFPSYHLIIKIFREDVMIST